MLRPRKDKIKDEQRITDLWSATAYNNTIVNHDFLDYQLASPNEIRPQVAPANDFRYSRGPRGRGSRTRMSQQSGEVSEGSSHISELPGKY